MPRINHSSLIQKGNENEGQGTLEDYFTNNGPRMSVTIKASHPSPDKTASTLSWSASPLSVISSMLGEEEHSVASFFNIQQQANSDSLLRVQVDSSVQKTTFYVPVSLMLQREVEMQEAAKHMNIHKDRWSSSRLFSLWKSEPRRGLDEITLRLSPETAMHDYSTLQWRPWLTTCIRAYYNTGTIRILDDCLGSDILLALEYFGILTTSPDTFVFDSYHAYERIKSWSAYFTHRDTIADWVLNDYRTKGGGTRIWATSPNSFEMIKGDALLQVKGETATVLAGGLDSYGYQLGCKVVYDLFCDIESEEKLTQETPARKRQDFCKHLLRSTSPNTDVFFVVEKVKITTSNGNCETEKRPVLRIRSELQTSLRLPPKPRDGSSNKHENRSLPRNQRASRSVLSDSSGMDIADMIGLGQTALDMANLKHPDNGIFGTGSLEMSVSSGFMKSMSSLSDIYGGSASEMKEHRTFRPYGRESNPDGPILTPRTVSASRSLRGSASGVSSSLIRQPHSSTMGNSPIEERHPQRSSPTPDAKRSSPENIYKQTVSGHDGANKPHISDQEFLKEIDAVSPIGFINTAFGDLRSVTSGLSGPFVDEASFIGRGSSAVEAAKKISLANSHQRLENSTEGPHKKAASSGIEEEKNSTAGSLADADSGAKPFSYWEQVLASICEAVVPGPSQNNRSSSPIREVVMSTVPVAVADDSKAMPSDAPSAELGELSKPNPETPSGAEGSYRTTSIEGMTAKWLKSEISGSKYRTSEENRGSKYRASEEKTGDDSTPTLLKSMSQDSGVFESAKVVGNNFSNQIDEFVRLALDATESSENTHQKERKKSKRSENYAIPPKRDEKREQKERKRSTIPDSLPLPHKSVNNNKEVDPVRRTSSGRSQEDWVRGKQSDLIAKQNRHRSESHTKEQPSKFSTFSHTKSNSFGSSSPVSSEVQLPPREPRRARVLDTFAIARRKKQSAQSMHPPRHPNDPTIPTNPSQNSSKSLSTAKAKNVIMDRPSPFSSVASKSEQSASEVKGGRRKGMSLLRRKK